MAASIPERWTTGWRGPALAALAALFAALPAAFALPLLDRQEARTIQATAQMLESGDFVAISFQDRTRDGEPVGVHWLQAASVALVSKVEARDVLPYRLPSLFAAMLLAAATVWGAGAYFLPRIATAAGIMAAATLALSLAGGMATSQACVAAGLVLAVAALGRLYAAAKGLITAGRRTRILLWAGLTLAVLTGGWIPAATAALTGLVLFARDRAAPWARTLGWGWGLIALGLVVGPWVMAITVTTDGGYWSGPAVDSAAWTPPGAPSLAAILLFFPFAALLPSAAAFAWRERATPAVRFATAWLAAALLTIEASPNRSVAAILPLIPPLAWLAAAAFGAPSRRLALSGAALSGLCALVLAGTTAALLVRYGQAGDLPAAAGAAFGFLAAGGLAASAVLKSGRGRALIVAGAVGLAAHGLLIGGLLPRLEPLWPSQRAVEALARLGLHPRDGLVQGPVTVAGYAEPSLIFALGARTEVGDVTQAAAAIGEGRPAIVEGRQEKAFSAAVKKAGRAALPVATVAGLDYADGEEVRLTIWRSAK